MNIIPKRIHTDDMSIEIIKKSYLERGFDDER